MVEFYRDLLSIICLGLLGWGILRMENIYQYPFFIGSMFVSFILPQAFALTSNPAQVTPEALERVLFVSCLCAAACWIGYQVKPNQQWLARLNIVIDERKLFIGGIVLMTQAWFFNFLLSRTVAQTGAFGGWTGPATIYLFLIQAGNIAFGIFLLYSLKRPKPINFILTIISGWPLFSQVIIGRRQPMMTFAIIIGLSFFLVRRYVPPRWLVITGMLSVILLIPVLGLLRGGFWNLVFSGNWQELLSSVQTAFNSQQKGELLELRNAALLIDVADRTGLYGYGTGWWDTIVFQFVPGQIVGFEFKKSLQFNLWPIYLDALKNLYGYSIPNGYTITGIGDSFMEFSYFGCLSFAIIAYILKHLWISSVYYKSIFSQLLYMGLVSPAMVGLTHGIGRFWQESIFQLIFIGLVTYYSKNKYKLYSSKSSNIS